MKLPQAEKKPGLFKRLWISLWQLTPVSFRRMSLLSLLYARFAECNEDELDRLKRVNKAMRLTRDVRCMRFTVCMAPYMGGRILPVCRIDSERADTYVTRILKNMPCWLNYGAEETLRKDISDLLQYCFKERSGIEQSTSQQ